LNINIRRLKILRTLFSLMKLRLFYFTGVVVIESSVRKMKLLFDLIFASDRKALMNLCFGAALRTIKMAYITVRNLKLHKKNVILSEKLSSLILRINLFYRSNRSLKRRYVA
jgi:hypothetical protein